MARMRSINHQNMTLLNIRKICQEFLTRPAPHIQINRSGHICGLCANKNEVGNSGTFFTIFILGVVYGVLQFVDKLDMGFRLCNEKRTHVVDESLDEIGSFDLIGHDPFP